MLGAAFFHMLPESAHLASEQFGLWMAVGVIGLYVIERFLSPHSHDTSTAELSHAHHHDHDHDHDHTEAEAEVEPDVKSRGQRPPAAPQVTGWPAVAGLTIHTLLGGVALGSAALGPGGLGLAVFLATVLHKPADALTISTLLIKGGTSRRKAFVVQCCFAMMIPLGVVLFHVGRSTLVANLESSFTGCVLGFSAGTFVCIALSDLLPEVQFHSHDRLKLFLAVLLGAGIMWATSLIEPSH
jgi:zinc and cadmium transporter